MSSGIYNGSPYRKTSKNRKPISLFCKEIIYRIC